MGGLVLDVWVAFFLRTLANGLRRIRSRSWPTATAIVYQAYVEPSGGFGCAVATVSYDYLVAGKNYSGTHDEPCLFRRSAEDFGRLYPKGKRLTVRHDSRDPSRSVALI
jgi:hypothetical protein